MSSVFTTACRRAAGFVIAACFGISPLSAESSRPNIVLIIADDLGYSDAGCYGGEVPTPSLDRLADEGVRLANFRNCGMCVITRASAMTGQWWPRGLREFRKTRLLPERLHDLGYRCGLIGKWHLDGDPLDRGFDHFFGFLGGFSDHFAGGEDYRLGREPFRVTDPDFYSSDAFTDRALRFIAESKGQPFFLCLSYQAPHNPLQAPAEDIAKHRGTYQKGWQAVREARFRKQKELGLFPNDRKLPAHPQNLPAWDSLNPRQKDLEDLRIAVYAAMVERMDRGIGRVVDALRDSNTLVVFLSDNGTDPFSKVDREMPRQGKLPGSRGSNWQPGTGWAYACVTPWRLYTISQHAGGTTTGAIAWWPGHVKQAGSIRHEMLHVADLLPSFLDAAEGEAGESAGVSFLPLLRGGPWKREGPLCFQYMDNRSIHTDEWSLAEVDGAGWELFDAAEDPFQTNDLAAKRPEVVARLETQWTRWWKRESGKPVYQPKSTADGPHYEPQGDRGSGRRYHPTEMPEGLHDGSR